MLGVAPVTKVINFGESRGVGHQELSCGFSKGFFGDFLGEGVRILR